MTGRRAVGAIAAVLLVSMVIAVTFSEGSFISIRIWLTSSVIGITLVLVVRLVAAAEVEPARVMVAWRWRPRSRRPTPLGGVPGLRSTETLMVNAPRDLRAHVNQLRPRLIELAEHHLPPARPGDSIDGPRRTTALGDVAWLIDPTINDRAPTLDEIDRFLDRVGTEAGT